ncbi:MAG: CDP-alcohol phosphatidyltransferase family protein [Clostridia bacterium]|nr:CDP-alcohol phosphatidyltransferase family protein [Clostridia bacterium]
MNTYERMEIFGRRTRLALAVDALLYATILWVTLCYLLRGLPLGTAAASLFCAAAAIVAFWLIRRHGLRGKTRLRERVRAELALERLLLMPEPEARALFSPDAVLLKTTVSRDDLLRAVRAGERVLWLCGEPDADANAFLQKNGALLNVRTKEQTAARSAETVSEAAVEAELVRRSRRKKQLPTLRELLQNWKPNRFTLLGILLMGLSFLTPYRIWFRVVASGCFVIGSLLYTRAIAARAHSAGPSA